MNSALTVAAVGAVGLVAFFFYESRNEGKGPVIRTAEEEPTALEEFLASCNTCDIKSRRDKTHCEMCDGCVWTVTDAGGNGVCTTKGALVNNWDEERDAPAPVPFVVPNQLPQSSCTSTRYPTGLRKGCNKTADCCAGLVCEMGMCQDPMLLGQGGGIF